MTYPDDYVDDGRIWCYATIESEGSYTISYANGGPSSWTQVEIDGVVSSSILKTQTLAAGDHILKFTLSDPTVVPTGMFRNVNIYTEICFPDAITTLADYLFYPVSAHTKVHMNMTNITSIGAGVFKQAYVEIGDLYFPNLQTIGVSAFEQYYGAGTTEIKSLGNITAIPDSCFCNVAYKRRVIPATVNSIGTNGLLTWDYDKVIICYAETPPTVGSQWTYRPPQAIYVPSNCVAAYKSATGWSSYASVIYPIWEEKLININHLSLGDFRRRIMLGISKPIIPNYFYVQDESGLGGLIWFPGRNTPTINLIECSTDLENWTSYPSISTSTKITLPAGGRVYFRGTNTGIATGNNSWRWLQCDVAHSVGGRLEYLLDKSGHPATVSQYAFKGFFNFYNADNTTLVDASKLTLKILGSATEFYRSMFGRCTSLTKGPFIDMDYIPTRACQELFINCSSLQEVKCTATNISGSYTTTSWMQGVAATGTFYKAATMTSWPRNANGIPSGWTVVDL